MLQLHSVIVNSILSKQVAYQLIIRYRTFQWRYSKNTYTFFTEAWIFCWIWITGYLVSCASPSVTVALSIGPPLIIPFLLFGGFFLNVGYVFQRMYAKCFGRSKWRPGNCGGIGPNFHVQPLHHVSFSSSLSSSHYTGAKFPNVLPQILRIELAHRKISQ